jgi:superfamily II DNA or RNA helicase
MTVELWPHQKEAISATLSAIRSRQQSGLWVMPTGAGKTRAFLTLARQLGLRTLVVVHRDEPVRQTAAALGEVWPTATVATIPGQGRQPAQVVVATVQSLRRKLPGLPPEQFGLVILDEAHHAPATSWGKVVEHFRPQFLLGCTATPERLDGKELSGLFGQEPLYTYELEQAIEEGYLVRFCQRAILTDVSLDEVKARMGDFSVRALASAVATQARNAAIVRAYLEHAPDRKALVFAVDLRHVEQLREEFEKAGVPVAAVTGGMKLEARREVLRSFKEGAYRVLVGCEVLTEGYDEQSIGCVVMARPTLSKALYQQCVGRGLRLHSEGGKRDCLVLDIRDRCSGQRLVTASQLFGAEVPDCEGGDVLQAAGTAREGYKRRPLDPSPSLRARWATGEETPWGAIPNLESYQARGRWEIEPATERQLRAIRRFGLDLRREVTRGEAWHLLSECNRLDRQHPTPATPSQESLLKWYGRWRPGTSKREATRIIIDMKRGPR